MISKSQVKYIQSLGQKKYRDEEGVFIAEGPKIINELLNSANAELKHLYALDEWIAQHEKTQMAVSPTEISAQELERISQLKSPNKVLGIFKKFDTHSPVTKGNVSLVLDGIQDPGNLGTIVRVADWFSVQHIICSPDCADIYNSKTVQATMGSIARVQVHYAHIPDWLMQQNIRIYAALLEGTEVSTMSPIKEGLIVIGNESRGVRDESLSHVDERITIPKKGKAESLNAAVAAGIILSHLT